jgi:CheY-like chemotaxis protein
VIGDDAMLRLDAPPSDEDRIKGDPDALRLALIAIAEWIAARRVAGAAPGVVEMRVDASGASSVRLVIFDSSPGLNDLERARLFDPENRAGLATLEGILERHGGRALVDGGPDQGTHFHIEFPRPEAAPRPDRPSRELVLVIEDDDDIRELATDILELNGFEVLAAANGVEASVILRQRYRDLDAVLVDAVLPGRSGLDLIEEARSLRVALPVLLMSSYSKGFLGPRLRADIPVLSKPFGPGDLVRRVREVLDS